MKRLCWLVAFVLVISAVSGYIVLKTGETGKSPCVYGDFIVFESDGRIILYNTIKQSKDIIGKGSDPSMFAFHVVFQASDNGRDVLQMTDIRDLHIVNLNLTGRHPSIYSNVIAFSAKESELGVDYDNDGSLSDTIIFYHDLSTGDTINTRAQGDFPAVGSDYIVFQTTEQDYGHDLTGDKDTDDAVIRSFDFQQRGVHSSGIVGGPPVMNPDDLAVFVSEGEIVLYDAGSGEITRTGLAGADPWITDDAVIFSYDGELAAYDIESKSFARTGIPGNSPALFDLVAAYVEDGMVRFVRAEDLDDDGVDDLRDNCVHVNNSNQTDSDNDGVGDVCDERTEIIVVESEAAVVPVVVEEQSGQNAAVAEKKPEKSGLVPVWLVIILLIPLIGFGVWYFPKYWRKRKKGFGF